MQSQQLQFPKIRYRSSPNIAWIKYWGKFDEVNIIPYNDSIGFTLNSQDIFTITTIQFKKEQTQQSKDTLVLNGQQSPITNRVEHILGKVKHLAKERKYKQVSQWEKYFFRIVSQNSFPTASGLASSASGLACLVAALNGLFGNILTNEEVSQLARRGSGSAARSIYGGLVKWNGVPKQIALKKFQSEQFLFDIEALNKLCISHTVVQPEKLSFFSVFILVANQNRKDVSSTSGMEQSMKTSELIKYRNQIAARRSDFIIKKLQTLENEAEGSANFTAAFNEICQTIIKDSNQFHAVCLDTFPPITYLNEFSKQIMYIVDHIFNTNQDMKYKVAYTFDAGPHAFLFMHKNQEKRIFQYFEELYDLSEQSLNQKSKRLLKEPMQKNTLKKYQKDPIKPLRLWITDVGKGVQKFN